MATVFHALGAVRRVGGARSSLARRAALAVLAMHLALLALDRQLHGLDFAAMSAAFAAIPPFAWALACVTTFASFWAVGRYDRVVHRALGTGVRPQRASRAGIVAIALSQTVGLGVVTGSLIRWRLLPELGMKTAAKVSLMVALSFLLALAPLLALAILFGGEEVAAFRPFAWAALTALAAAVPFVLWPPAFAAHWPRLPRAAMIRVLGLVIADVGGAALTIYVLLPFGTISFVHFLPIYALALAAGLMAGTPAGAGAFELTLLALVPFGDEMLMAAILAYRVVYYLGPALLAAAWLAALELAAKSVIPTRPQPFVRRSPMDFDRAEARLADVGQRKLLAAGSSALLTARAGSSLVAIGPALDFAADPSQTLAALRAEARYQLLSPCLYKCDGRLAAGARAAGWCVRPIADEAVLHPMRFDLAGPTHRQLRRKLRKADDSGVIVRSARAGDTAECQWIASNWDEDHGGERGFSMGGAEGLARALGPVFVATRRQDGAAGEVIAFISFLAGRGEWSLDLMRHTSDVPDGTMHLLVTEAVLAARRHGIRRLSLAAVPAGLAHVRPCPDALKRWFDRQSGAFGLRQFKMAFAPVLEPRYLAAPGPVALVLAGLAILRQITAPARALAADCKSAANLSPVQPNTQPHLHPETAST